MNAFLSTAILLAGLTQVFSGAAGGPGTVPPSGLSTGMAVSQAVPKPRGASSISVRSGNNLVGWPMSLLPEYAADNVLVVPAPDLPPQNQADLTQDLTVMCRIFGTTVPFTTSGQAPVRLTRNDVSSLGIVLGPMTCGAQALYLNGYGALFFLHVDYPLVPTEPQEQAQATTQEPADPVWSRTVREMAGQTGDEQQTARKTPAYDARRVEELQQALIKTLVHCANIRMPRPQDRVTLVVGDLDESKGPNFRILSRMRYELATGAPGAVTGSPSQPGGHPPTATLLILRATKADVDAFAKGQLTLVQFTDKIQSLWSPPDQTTPATAPAPTTGARR